MKNLLYIIIAAFCITLSFTGCTLEMSENGDFDGFWHLRQIDTLANKKSVNVKDSAIYWSIQLNMIDVRFVDDRHKECVMKFEKNGDTLSINTPCYFNHTDGDVLLDNAEPLRPYGINSLNDKFIIEHLSSGHMELKSDKLRLYFKKL